MRFFLKIYFLINYLTIFATKNLAQNVPKSNPVITYSIVACGERNGQPTGLPWEGIVMDIRIDDIKYPIKELKRLIRIHIAYQHSNKGDHNLEINEVEKALAEYGVASKLYQKNLELPYWLALNLVWLSKLGKASTVFSKVFKKEPRLRMMNPWLVDAVFLPKDGYILR